MEFYTGTVISANPSTLTCDIIKTEGGIEYNVPIANTMGGLFSNDIQWSNNLRGALVYYAEIDGSYYVLGTLPYPRKRGQAVHAPSVHTEIGGDNMQTYGASENASYAGSRESDYQPNDKVIVSDGDAKVVFMGEGGLALHASPLSKIFMGSGMDFIKIICRAFDLFTDFGSFSFAHGSSGRTGLTIKGGAVYGEEAQPEVGTNTVFMYLGDTNEAPEVRFGVRVTDVAGNEFGAIALGKDGRLILTTSKNAIVMIGEDVSGLVDQNVYWETKGNQHLKVRLNSKREIGMNETVEILGKLDTLVVKDETRTVNGNRKTSISGSETVDIGGPRTTNVGGDDNLTVAGWHNLSCEGYGGDCNSWGITVKGSENHKVGGGVNYKCSSFNISK